MTDDQAGLVGAISFFTPFILLGIFGPITYYILEGVSAKRYEGYHNTSKFFVYAWCYDQGYRLAKTAEQQRLRDRARIQHREDNARRKGIL
jgi:hypothetical protein